MTSLKGPKGQGSRRIKGSKGQLLEALGRFWKEFCAEGNGGPQKGSKPGKVMVGLVSVLWALSAFVHSGPPSPRPRPTGAHSPVAPAVPSP